LVSAIVPAMMPLMVLELELLVIIVRLDGLEIAPEENAPVPELIVKLVVN